MKSKGQDSSFKLQEKRMLEFKETDIFEVMKEKSLSSARHRNLINYLADKSRYLLEISSASHSTGMNEDKTLMKETSRLREIEMKCNSQKISNDRSLQI